MSWLESTELATLTQNHKTFAPNPRMEVVEDNTFQPGLGDQGIINTDGDGMSVISSLSGAYNNDFFRSDGLTRFNRINTLYGRIEEVKVLMEAFKRVSVGPSEVVLVSGEAGSGKTKVIEELRNPVTSTEFNGFYVQGKYDQQRVYEPFSAIAAALSDLVEITSLTEVTQKRREDIAEAIGVNAGILCQIIPSVSLLVEDVIPPEDQADCKSLFPKLTLAFRKLFEVLATKDSPVFLFLDDIQWADSESLQLFKSLITNVKSKHVLLVFAYRDNDSNSSMVEEIFACCPDDEIMMDVRKVVLSNLNIDSINQLICDQLELNAHEALPLSECVWKKTLGNCYYVLEFLDELIEKGLIVRDCSSWIIEFDRIHAETSVSSNVVEVITEKLQRLHAHMRAVLTYAAYIGFQFRVDVLNAIVSSEFRSASPILLRFGITTDEIADRITLNHTHEIVERVLEVAMMEGIVEKNDKDGTKMKFVHDYPQTILYNSVSEGEKRATLHLRIGRRMREMAPTNSKELLFAVVHHLNLGSSRLFQERDLLELATLNLDAAQGAVGISAYFCASEYLKCGIRLLDPDTMWSAHYDLCLGLHSLAAHTEYCIGDFERSGAMVQSILVNARSIQDKVSAYYAEIDALSAQANQTLAIEKGMSILRLLGEKVRRKPTTFNILLQLAKTRLMLCGKTDEFILSLQLLDNDKLLIALMTILNKIQAAAFISGEVNVLLFAIMRQLQLSLQFGRTALSASAFSMYGLLQSKLGNTDSAYRFGNLAEKLIDSKAVECRTLTVVYMFTAYFKSTIEPQKLRDVYISGAAHGDLVASCLAAFSYVVACIHFGTPLPSLNNDCQSVCEGMQAFQQESPLNLTNQYWWVVSVLMSAADLHDHPLNEKTNEAEIVEQFSVVNPFLVATCRLTKLIVACHEGNIAAAMVLLDKLARDEQHLRGHFTFLIYKFYAGLTLYSMARCLKEGRYLRNADKVRRYMKKLHSRGCPTATLFLSFFDAERTFLLSNDAEKVLTAYHQAIDFSFNNGFVNYEGLACERACFAAVVLGVDALPFVDRAIECYSAWGATRKTQRMQFLRDELSHAEPIDMM